MSKAPAMPMYWDAYLADTTHLTTEEHGAYMLLLAAMWRRNGSVPDDDKDNARILGLTPAKWRKVKARFVATISGFCADGDAITQEKLQKTWKNTQEKIAKNVVNGAKGGRAAASKINDLGQANATETLKPKATIPEPEPEPEPEPKLSKREANASLDDATSKILAQVCFLSMAENFVAFRRELGKPMTERSARAMVTQLSGHHDPDAVLNSSISNGWQGIFPEKIKPFTAINGGYNGQSNSNTLHGRGAGSQAAKRPDASLERIARLAGVVQTSGDDRL